MGLGLSGWGPFPSTGPLTVIVLPSSNLSLIAPYPFKDFTLIVLLFAFCFLGGINSISSLKNLIIYINIQNYFYTIIYKSLRWIKFKKVYIDSGYKNNDSESNSDFNFGLKESLDLPDNTVCDVGDICIPHTWRTIESHNNRFYIIPRTEVINEDTTRTYNWLPYALTLPVGNYNGFNLASGIQDLLNANEINFTFEVVYNTATGTIKVEEKSEGIHASNAFEVPSDFGIAYWGAEHNGVYPWRNTDETIVYPDADNLQSINGALRNTHFIPVYLSYMYKKYESNVLALLSIHNMYMHCPDL